jgi:dTDP-D-glucose 4,6-dehydratase
MEYSVLEIAHLLIHMIKGPQTNADEWIEYVEDRPYNDQRYYISNEKVKQLGWVIKKNLVTGLQELIPLAM